MLTFFSFNGFRLASRLHYSLASVVEKEGLDELSVPKHYGDPMSQGSNWNLTDRYGESLHCSDVVNSRELKFCEGCGVLLVRLRGSKTQFCPGCEAPVAIAMGDCNDDTFE